MEPASPIFANRRRRLVEASSRAAVITSGPGLVQAVVTEEDGEGEEGKDQEEGLGIKVCLESGVTSLGILVSGGWPDLDLDWYI